MLRALTAYILLIFSTQVFAQSDEYKEAWNRTGYGFEELYNEPDFSPLECEKSDTLFMACMMAFENVLRSFETPQTLSVEPAGEITIVSAPEVIEKLEYEEYLALQQELRTSFSNAFTHRVLGNVSTLFSKIKELSLENIPASDQAAIAGGAYGVFLSTAYDPRTSFMPEELTVPKANKYFGIGANVEKYKAKGYPSLEGALAINPMPGSPAKAAGLKKGDLVIAVDGVPVKDETTTEIVARIKGEVGTTVKLTIESVCDESVKDVTVTRGPISVFPDWLADSHFVSLNKDKADAINSACSEDSENLIAGEPQALYVPLSTFQDKQGQSLCREFVSLQLKDLRNRDSVGMILDLRGNGGGLVHEVSCMLDSIISDSGPLVGRLAVNKGQIVGTEIETMYEFHPRGFIKLGNGQVYHYNKKIVVLIDGGSASASEIFAGTMQDMQRGWVVGDKSIGKGSMQARRPHSVAEELSSPEDTRIMFSKTTAIYTLNSGRSPQRFGIIPDFRFNELGEPIIDEEGALTTEAKSFNSLKFENNKWEQTRPEEFAQTSACTTAESSISENFKKHALDDERYQRPFISSYQMDLAKDVLLCEKERSHFL